MLSRAAWLLAKISRSEPSESSNAPPVPVPAVRKMADSSVATRSKK